MKNLISSDALIRDAKMIYSPTDMTIGKHSMICVKTQSFGSYDFDAYSDVDIKAHVPLKVVKIATYNKRNEYEDQTYAYVTLFVRPK